MHMNVEKTKTAVFGINAEDNKSTPADLRQGESGPDPVSVSRGRIRIRNPDPDFGSG